MDGPGYRAWRLQDSKQRVLDHAILLWDRYVEDNRRAVDGCAEQLRAMGSLSALVAGFVMVAFVQFSFDPGGVPLPVLLGFGITNALTVALNVCCMSMCTLILASIFKTYTSLISSEEQAVFIAQCCNFALCYKPGDVPPKPVRNFQFHWEVYCRPEWHRALAMFTIGVATFMGNIIFAAFIKFRGYQVPAILISGAVGLSLLYYMLFVSQWILELNAGSRDDAFLTMEAEGLVHPVGLPFDWHLPPRAATRGALPPPVTPDLGCMAADMGMEAAWREEDLQQTALDNAYAVWTRFVERQRNDMDERAEQLRGFSFLSGIVAGFIVASFLQVTFNPLQTSRGFQLAFAVTVGLTATLTTCSMATCSVVLLSILKTAGSLVSEQEEAHFMAGCQRFYTQYKLGDRPPAPRRTFRTHWELRCEQQWYRAFYMFSLGLVFFVVNLIFAGWIKFSPNKAAPACVTVILALALIYLSVTHGRWAKHIFGRKHQESFVQPMGLPFDWWLPPSAPAHVSGHFRPLAQLKRMKSWLPSVAGTFTAQEPAVP